MKYARVVKFGDMTFNCIECRWNSESQLAEIQYADALGNPYFTYAFGVEWPSVVQAILDDVLDGKHGRVS